MDRQKDFVGENTSKGEVMPAFAFDDIRDKQKDFVGENTNKGGEPAGRFNLMLL